MTDEEFGSSSSHGVSVTGTCPLLFLRTLLSDQTLAIPTPDRLVISRSISLGETCFCMCLSPAAASIVSVFTIVYEIAGVLGRNFAQPNTAPRKVNLSQNLEKHTPSNYSSESRLLRSLNVVERGYRLNSYPLYRKFRRTLVQWTHNWSAPIRHPRCSLLIRLSALWK